MEALTLTRVGKVDKPAMKRRIADILQQEQSAQALRAPAGTTPEEPTP